MCLSVVKTGQKLLISVNQMGCAAIRSDDGYVVGHPGLYSLQKIIQEVHIFGMAARTVVLKGLQILFWLWYKHWLNSQRTNNMIGRG